MSTDNSYWRFSNPIEALWGKQYVKDMANYYSINGDASMKMTQAELCSLEDALNDALTSNLFTANRYFDQAFINFLENDQSYSSDFINKLTVWDLMMPSILPKIENYNYKSEIISLLNPFKSHH